MTGNPRVVCRRTGCVLRDHVVTTKMTECLSCGSDLKPEVGDLLDGLFGKTN